MKYLKKLPVQAIENLNRVAWERKLGRPKRPEDVTEFLCPMIVAQDGNSAELHISEENEQYFTAQELKDTTDTKTIMEETIEI